MNKSSNTEVNQPVEMTPFVINYYGRLGRRRLHFVNLIMPAATQWLDPFPVLASRGSEAVLQLLLYVASRKKVVSLYSYVC